MIAIIGIFITSCIKKPEACIEASNDNPSLGETVSFTDCSTNAEDFELDFGDGSNKVDKSDDIMTHVYETPGTFTVSLTAYSKEDKKSNETTLSIVVQEPTDGDISGTWNLYKEEERNTFLDPVAMATYSADVDYVFSENDTVIIESIVEEYNLVPSTGEITIDGSLYNIVKLFDNEMILKEEIDEFEYILMYFEKQ
ncbi:MAG: hypothetical protein A2W98_14865 [Bacteroidetes bacterium GWF2_33_38]|nr:MAG: hypothetical protein A2W98_14865 [Bacteroidetes bacterium GWF2_33_38]OFY91331.1 MAG: hypothetical protein A2236_13770 [Bacteroidetes bacterium RIFOXYA2_FULL_33_7]